MASPALKVVKGGLPDGDRDDLRMLYEKHGATVYSRCLYLMKDRAKAEDAMHDVFARAMTHLAGFRAEASPVTWLVKIATHHCLNQLRGERAAWRGLFERQEQARWTATGNVLEQREVVRALLSRFDLETQSAAIHYYVDEMTLEEVASALGRSVPTIRKRLENFARLSGQELRADV